VLRSDSAARAYHTRRAAHAYAAACSENSSAYVPPVAISSACEPTSSTRPCSRNTIRSAERNGAGTAEPFPLTATFTFLNATYTSKYLTFTSVEELTNIPDKATGSYTPLQTPTAAQQALIQKYDGANNGAIPFIDYGNKFMSVGASYNPGVLSGLSWTQIADDLSTPSSAVAQGVLGTANYATAAICGLTGDQPATACTPAVKALQAKI